MTATKQTELLPCPFCGGAVQFHSDEDCHGCHYIECSGCKAMFDFSPTTDPENQCDSLHEMQCGIAHTWNSRAQSAPEPVQGEVEIPDIAATFDGLYLVPILPLKRGDHLMTVAQHRRIMAALTAPHGIDPALTNSQCACGDEYAANSYGAGFMAANNGVCENCDAYTAAAKPYAELVDVLRRLIAESASAGNRQQNAEFGRRQAGQPERR